jgi:outer membrane autotransporter protein
MIPISNSISATFEIHGDMFREIETRVASLRNDYLAPIGMNAGDLSTGGSMWISGTGSFIDQGPNGDDDGYNEKTGIFLFGTDVRSANKANVLGVAGGFSTSYTKELSNAGFINHTERYHGIFYGSHDMRANNYLDWLVSGSFNHNINHRDINVNGVNLTTHGNFYSYQVAGKISRSKSFDFCDSYRLTPLTYLQYVFLHQNSYSETGSVAALNVEQINKNIATVAAGLKFDMPLDAWKCIGMRELRAAVVYDFINNKNITNAAFVVGSNDFAVVSSPVRLGVIVGAGVTYDFCDHLLFELNYDFEYRARFTDNSVMVKFKWVF